MERLTYKIYKHLINTVVYFSFQSFELVGWQTNQPHKQIKKKKTQELAKEQTTTAVPFLHSFPLSKIKKDINKSYIRKAKKQLK